jgi:hypothetical protein
LLLYCLEPLRPARGCFIDGICPGKVGEIETGRSMSVTGKVTNGIGGRR